MRVLLVSQVLKPVNQRAQSKVPPPDDMDLERAVDGSALDRLLAFEVGVSKIRARERGEGGGKGSLAKEEEIIARMSDLRKKSWTLGERTAGMLIA